MQSSDKSKRIKTQAFLRGKARMKATEARLVKAEEIAASELASGENCPLVGFVRGPEASAEISQAAGKISQAPGKIRECD